VLGPADVARRYGHLLPLVCQQGLRSSRCPADAERLDPPGLLSELRVHRVSESRWQYIRVNLVLFERGAQTFIYAPRRQDGSALRSLPGYCDADRARSAYAARAWDAWNRDLQGRPSVAPSDVDLAPALLGDMRRLAQQGDVAGALGLLRLIDVLDQFSGEGGDDLNFSDVEETQRPIAREGTAWTVTALLRKTRRHDGTHGGYTSTLVRGCLFIGAEGWSYERATLFEESEEGDALS
jgi:hypothetical protein